MGDTFNAFVKFISEDPIMLGLCIAIVVLVILFIIVLLIGNKKEEIIEESNISKDENAELLKTEVNLEALKSTQEYKINEISSEPVVNNTPDEQVSVIQDFNPSSLNDNSNLGQSDVPSPSIASIINEQPNEPVVPSFESFNVKGNDSINVALNNESVNLSLENSSPIEENIFDTPVSQVEMPVLNKTEEKVDTPVMPTIMESKINPVEPVQVNSTNQVDTEQLLDTFLTKKSNLGGSQNLEMPKVETPSLDLGFNTSSEIKTDNFSKTEIIKHIPKMETNIFDTPVIQSNTEVIEDDDDIVLPKLNTNVDNSRLSSLSGETFNIK